ncbi:MRN complex-interacting protein isoform X2 [Girardinichthys multiradiatus]|uniref:MRN complex-interacting protein isoform X2 n=1 Tax=Girardinichthys multiradiatus TaxID=208333 RepID=UPI001FADF245|nr:MRN complex-interacting protein isoform X2 [Girardinichthys multiradiatus]
MVQEFHVVRCFRCLSFQVQQVKKVKKWSCKLCGEKQSLLKEFGRGSGADCRRHVQKLNAMRGAMMEDQEDNTCEQVEAEEEEETEHTDDQVRPSQVSRWGKYLDTPQEEESKEEVLVGRNHLHGSNTNSRKRQRSEELADGRREDGCIPAKLQLPAVTSDATSSHSGSGSRWSHFLRAHRQGVECSVSGWSQSTGAVATKACSDDITLRPQFPVPSMFESGEEFNFDDDFQSF